MSRRRLPLSPPSPTWWRKASRCCSRWVSRSTARWPGGHFVVAIGIAADGSIVIQDPSPLFARTNLNDYLNGFTAGAGTWTAGLRGVVRFAVRSPSGTRFMVGALSQPASLMQNFALAVNSAAGACGVPLDLLDAVDSSGNPPAAGALISRIDVCDGSQPAYQIAVGAAQPYRAFVTDLASGGSSMDISGNAAATYKATRPLLALAVGPQDVSFTAGAVVNAATFTSGIAPGGIMAIFGTGLSAPGLAPPRSIWMARRRPCSGPLRSRSTPRFRRASRRGSTPCACVPSMGWRSNP